jgi:hypothetical protein
MMRRNRTFPRVFMIAAMLAGIGLVAAATSASAAPSPASHSSGAARPAALLPFDINGPWTDNGSAKPVITTAAGAIVIDMSYAHRPTASGSVLDASSILVNFSDAGPYIGTFVGPAVLRWSNGSIWQKVYTGPTAIDLNDNWTDGLTAQHISNTSGFIKVIMTAVHRPNGTGFLVRPDMFLVTFPDDPNTTFATLRAGFRPALDHIVWSNGSQWSRVPPVEGPPVCLQPGMVLC